MIFKLLRYKKGALPIKAWRTQNRKIFLIYSKKGVEYSMFDKALWEKPLKKQYLRVQTKLLIYFSSRLLQDTEGLDNRHGHPLRGTVSDGKVHDRSQGLGSVVLLIWNLNRQKYVKNLKNMLFVKKYIL